MDPKVFSPHAPGRLVPALNKHRKPDTGFIPDPLPSAWTPPPATRALLEKAHAAIGALRQAGARSSAPRLASEFLQLREAIRSSASDRTLEETRQLLSFEISGSGKTGPLKAWREALAYRRVLASGHASIEGGGALPLRALVQRLHASLFQGRPRRGVYPGRLRRGPIQMGDIAHYVPPPYAWVVPCLTRLERDLARRSAIDPLVLAFMTHYQFTSIHPFADGNGRMARMLLALMANRAGGLSPPLLYLGAFIAAHKRPYAAAQFRVNTHGEWPVWVDFCLRGVIAECAEAARIVAALEALRNKYRSGTLLDALLVAPAFSAPQFAALCARLGRDDPEGRLERLQRTGIVHPGRAGGRTRWFFAPAVIGLLTSAR